MRQLKAHKATKAKTMEDVKAIELIGKLTERFTRTCPPQPEYQQRLAEEFEIILDLRFVDYFLQIRDILDITQDIPHMTRGSAGSSGTFLWHDSSIPSEMIYQMWTLTIHTIDKKRS